MIIYNLRMSGHALGNAIKVLMIPLIFILMGVDGCKELTIEPPGGDYTDAQEVTITAEDATAIYYTLDGSDPGSSCLEYESPFTIAQTTVLKAIAFYETGEYSLVATETYSIEGSADDTTYTNEAMVYAWMDYESLTRQVFADKYFDGCEPVVGCDGGIDLGDLGLYLICDADASITDASECEAAGGGWITWDVAAEGFGGKSVFTYRNYTQTLTDSGSLSATGIIVGHFDANGSGRTNTGVEGETIVISGAYNGQIDDAVAITDRQKTGGVYISECDDDGCAQGPASYLVSEGPVLTLVPMNGPSCAPPPFYHIQNGPNCLTPWGGMNSGDPSVFVNCDGYSNTFMHWEINPNNDTPAADDYRIKLRDGVMCLTAVPDEDYNPPLPPGWHMISKKECSVENAAAQAFSFAPGSDTTGNQTHILTHESVFGEALCLSPSFFGPPYYAFAVDCADDTKNRSMSIMLGTTTPPTEIHPDDLKPPPIVTYFNLQSLSGNNTAAIDVQSPDVPELTLQATATGENVGAESRGLGVKASCCDLVGIQKGEELVITFSAPVNIASITLKGWESPDKLKVKFGGEDFFIDKDTNWASDEEIVEVNLQNVTYFKLRGETIGTVAYLKSINAVTLAD
jgi:Chitobiase/beta-hexosaminidase C-terminal domain